MPQYTRAEQETIIRFDEEEKLLDIYTVSQRVALQLQRRGFALAPLTNPAHGWRLKGVPLNAITFRRIGPDVSGKPRKAASEGLLKAQAALKSSRRAAQVQKDAPTVAGAQTDTPEPNR